MKLGFVSAILEDSSFEEVIDFAAEQGFSCVELACWPCGKAERRYAGVSHLNVEELDGERIAYIKEYCKKRQVEISALAYYPNPLDENPEKRKAVLSHLRKVIEAADRLGVGMVTTFIGRMQTKPLGENLKEAEKVWKPLLRLAEEKQVKIAIENCPMLFTEDEWPGGQNLMITPAIFRELFRVLDSEMLGLNFDPSHFVWQQMDYVKPLYEFKDRIFHVHFKDIAVDKEKLDNHGILAAPLSYMSPRLPGRGDVDWKAFVNGLKETGYQGYTCIEVEDKEYEGSREAVHQALAVSREYMVSVLEGR